MAQVNLEIVLGSHNRIQKPGLPQFFVRDNPGFLFFSAKSLDSDAASWFILFRKEGISMMTVHEVSRRTGVSVRTLQYYDKMGLLPPTARTEAGYRLYDDAALERLQQILLFRALAFSLKEIQAILQSPNFDRNRALDQQIHLLTLKRAHIDNLITFARGLKEMGGTNMDFSAFDTAQMDEYAAQAKAQWQHTPAYQEYAKKSKGRSKEAAAALANGMMLIFADFGKCKSADPASPEAQSLVKRLQAYISENYYHCTPEMLNALGAMYRAGGSFTKNIDNAGGEGTAEFAARAIDAYCR